MVTAIVLLLAKYAFNLLYKDVYIRIVLLFEDIFLVCRKDLDMRWPPVNLFWMSTYFILKCYKITSLLVHYLPDQIILSPNIQIFFQTCHCQFAVEIVSICIVLILHLVGN